MGLVEAGVRVVLGVERVLLQLWVYHMSRGSAVTGCRATAGMRRKDKFGHDVTVGRQAGRCRACRDVRLGLADKRRRCVSVDDGRGNKRSCGWVGRGRVCGRLRRFGDWRRDIGGSFVGGLGCGRRGEGRGIVGGRRWKSRLNNALLVVLIAGECVFVFLRGSFVLLFLQPLLLQLFPFLSFGLFLFLALPPFFLFLLLLFQLKLLLLLLSLLLLLLDERQRNHRDNGGPDILGPASHLRGWHGGRDNDKAARCSSGRERRSGHRWDVSGCCRRWVQEHDWCLKKK